LASAGLPPGGPGVRLDDAIPPTPCTELHKTLICLNGDPIRTAPKADLWVERQLEARPVYDPAVQTLAEERAGQIVRSVAVETHIDRGSGTGAVVVGALDIDPVNAPELTGRDNEIVRGLVVVGVVLAVL
jgi:hypothetical protein